MDHLLAASIAPRRFNVVLIEVFAVFALVLAALGIYSVIAYVVTQQRYEIAIRMALGAAAGTVFKEVLAQGLFLTLTGITLGLAAALLVTPLLSGMLYAVTAADPPTYAVVSALLLITAIVACYIPALRATRIEPALALRAGDS